ncbi:hypothetical protein NQ318_006333 [Aromia moschata]|uniref:Cationic amino acid transporter C-terminal domain-containing protein n=1 Tax=Aromia moschata TaxID=1265417 RepID=A0AAV8XWG4_9CUCU|nr:hypothetical protein NQ318_006333 [Aromia moschata]
MPSILLMAVCKGRQGTIDNMRFKIPTWSEFQEVLTRKKTVVTNENSELAKVLNTLDLTALAVGSTLGVGVYVLAGDVAKNTAGPAVVVSFLIAALASILAGLCYAEFGARVPKAGSAYVYSYVCIGEFFAFIIGWNLILEYLIGSATVTKAIFLYIDELANKTMTNFFEEKMPLTGSQIASYADVFSLGLALVFSVANYKFELKFTYVEYFRETAIFLTAALAFGAKESSLVNNIFTFVNICVVLLVIISGLWKVDASNWSRTKEEANGYGVGGFVPYGLKGIIKGAARCFYGFIGFDCIATAGEEAKTPQKSIPISVVMSLLIVFLAYFGMSTVLTMILPYYEQDENAPLAHIYNKLGWTAIKYVVSVGAICGLFSSLLGAMFPLPRIIYAMASDGLLFKSLGKVHPTFHTPFMGTMVAGTIAGIIACLFELTKLTEMMSIGTLLAYSMVAACVLVLRYSVDATDKKLEDSVQPQFRQYAKQIFNRHAAHPTVLTSRIVAWEIVIFFILCFILSGLMTGFEDDLYNGTSWLIGVCSVLAAIIIFMLAMVSFQPSSNTNFGFSVPLVPWIPGISIFINIYLMTNIQRDTWIKYAYWIAAGLLIYFIFGMWNSVERRKKWTTMEEKSDDNSNGIRQEPENSHTLRSTS